jgi:hypothetical protein
MADKYLTASEARQLILNGKAPSDMHVSGYLNLGDCTGLTSLPEGLTVGGHLYLRGCTGLTALPAGLTVSGDLDLGGCTGLTSLPAGLTVSGYLDLGGCTGLTALPEDLTVGGHLDLDGCMGLLRPSKQPGVAGWLERNAVAVDGDGYVILYKRVSAAYLTQEERPWETQWTPGTTLVHPAWNPASGECGGGKYHACSRPIYCQEFRCGTGDKYIAIRVHVDDLWAWDNPQYLFKIGFQRGTVLYECDRSGAELCGGNNG